MSTHTMKMMEMTYTMTADDDDDGDRDDDTSTQEQPVDDTQPERSDTGQRPVPARRSSRQRQAPPWMRDGQFVMNMMCRAMMDAYSYKE